MSEQLIVPSASAAAFMRQSRVVLDMMPSTLLPASAPPRVAALWQQARTSADVAFKIGEDASVSEDDAIATITLMQTLGALVDDAERWEQRWVPTAAFTVAITNLATTVVTILAGLLPDPDGSG